MDDKTRNEMNAKLDILFDQIESLDEDKKYIAYNAVLLWQSAKIQEFLGMGPMEARSIYIDAYDTFDGMGLEVGGMIPPYRSV